MSLEFRIALGNELVAIRGIGSSWLRTEILTVAKQMKGFNPRDFDSDIGRMVATGILATVPKNDDDPKRCKFRYVVENPRYFPKVVGIDCY